MLVAAALSPFVALAIKIAFYALGAILLALGVMAWKKAKLNSVDQGLKWPGVRTDADTQPKRIIPKAAVILIPLGILSIVAPHTGLLQVDYEAMLRRWREARRYHAPTKSDFYRTDRDLNLTQARENVSTNLTRKIAAPQSGDTSLAAPQGAKLVNYASGDLQLKAWVSEDPNDQQKHPAVVFLHGGFALGEQDWQVLQPFRDAGFVVMTPSLRGENGNPGNFEFFYGEVDDAIAAGNYLAQLPYVDSDKIFVTGHSIGGRIVAMVGVSESVYRAAVAYSPSELNTAKWVEEIMRTEQSDSVQETLLDQDLIVFNPKSPPEVGLRDPAKFASHLQIPLVVYYESRRRFSGGEFAWNAERGNKPLLSRLVVGADHMGMLPKAIDESLPWLQFLSMVDTTKMTGSNIKEYWNEQSLDSFAVTSKFGEQTLDLNAFGSLSPGMAKAEVLEIMGPEGHFGNGERSPVLLEKLQGLTSAVQQKAWTHDSGTVIYTGFAEDGKLVTLGMSGNDSVFAAKYRELGTLVEKANVSDVEAILDEATFAVVDERYSYMVWTSDGQILAAKFDETDKLRTRITEPWVRLPRKRRQ